MKQNLTPLNKLLADWEARYAPNSAGQWTLSERETGVLFLNEQEVGPMNGASLVYAHLTIDRISFEFQDGQMLTVLFAWPEESNPVVQAAFFSRMKRDR